MKFDPAVILRPRFKYSVFSIVSHFPYLCYHRGQMNMKLKKWNNYYQQQSRSGPQSSQISLVESLCLT